jgi:hypothetical protein
MVTMVGIATTAAKSGVLSMARGSCISARRTSSLLLVGSAGILSALAEASAADAIDVCKIVTTAEAATILGALPPQPKSETEHVGFGVDMCMYVGPALSGQGAQTRFARLTVQAGRGKDASDTLQMDAEQRKATLNLPGVGEAAKRNEEGSFVLAAQGGVFCTAEISNGLPKGLTAESAASQLGGLCRKIFASIKS